ncbi:MAG TPA: hypothetical protein VF538_08355 [Pyrinomonadaceae bacterium]|jgi:hypothetical protein
MNSTLLTQDDSEEERRKRLDEFKQALRLPQWGAVTAFSSNHGVPATPIAGDEIDLSSQFDDFTVLNGVEVSPHARALITLFLRAILFDPHPAWQVDENKRRLMAGHFASNLHGYLNQIVRRENATSIITAYDVMHWTSNNLSLLCFIPDK